MISEKNLLKIIFWNGEDTEKSLPYNSEWVTQTSGVGKVQKCPGEKEKKNWY